MLKTWPKLMAFVALALTIAGCSRTNERNRSVVEISSQAEGGVFIAGMRSTGQDRFACTADDEIPAGHVPLLVTNRGYNSFVTATEGEPYGQFHVTGVQVEWVSVAGASPAEEDEVFTQLQRFNYQSGYDFAVPINNAVQFNLLVVPFSLSTDPYFEGLTGCGASPPVNPFSATARVVLTGHDSGSEEDVFVEGSVLVEFIGFVE